MVNLGWWWVWIGYMGLADDEGFDEYCVMRGVSWK